MMKRFFRISLALLSIFGLTMAFLTPRADAQSPYSLGAAVDSNEITTDETVTLTLTLTTPDGNAPQLNLPAMDGFNVVGSRTASQYNVMNGNASASMAYAFELQPTRTGDLTIPSLHLALNGQPLATDPITVHVTKGNGAPRQKQSRANGSPLGSLFGNDPFNDPFFTDPFGSDMFSGSSNLQIQAATNKPSVYVGEPLQYSVRVSSDGMLLGEPEYEAPKFTGFWAHQPPETQRGVNGSEITTLLFPTKAGKLTIDPATIRSDGGFFSNAMEKQTEPVTIEVKPLPQGAPKDFNGAVGQFEITATPDRVETRVGEPVTVKVEIRGTGNLDTLPDPTWQNGADWRAFDAKPQTSSQVANGKLSGTRTYERTLIPTKEGTLSIPGTQYVYFDPADGKYHTVETEAIRVQVAPGDPSLTQNIPGSTGSAADTYSASPAPLSGITLKPSSGELTTAAKPLSAQPLFLALFLIPLGVVAIDLGWSWRKRYQQANSATIRASRALKRAQGELKRAAKSQDVYATVAGIVQHYLEDRLNRSLNGVPHSEINAILLSSEIPPDLAARVIETLHMGESSEFGKMGMAQADQWVMKTAALLNQVDAEWAQ